MSKTIFRNNLMMAISEIIDDSVVEEEKIIFIIKSVYEKIYNAVDDSVRFIALSKENIVNRLLNVEEIVRLVAFNSPLVPIWINISLNESNEGKINLRF